MELYCETCKACALKHLSSALTYLEREDKLSKIEEIRLCGQLLHAAQHLCGFNEKMANRVRDFRMAILDDGMNLTMSSEMLTAFQTLVTEITACEKDTGAAVVPAGIPAAATRRSCGCRKKS